MLSSIKIIVGFAHIEFPYFLEERDKKKSLRL